MWGSSLGYVGGTLQVKYFQNYSVANYYRGEKLLNLRNEIGFDVQKCYVLITEGITACLLLEAKTENVNSY